MHPVAAIRTAVPVTVGAAIVAALGLMTAMMLSTMVLPAVMLPVPALLAVLSVVALMVLMGLGRRGGLGCGRQGEGQRERRDENTHVCSPFKLRIDEFNSQENRGGGGSAACCLPSIRTSGVGCAGQAGVGRQSSICPMPGKAAQAIMQSVCEPGC